MNGYGNGKSLPNADCASRVRVGGSLNLYQLSLMAASPPCHVNDTQVCLCKSYINSA